MSVWISANVDEQVKNLFVLQTTSIFCFFWSPNSITLWATYRWFQFILWIKFTQLLYQCYYFSQYYLSRCHRLLFPGTGTYSRNCVNQPKYIHNHTRSEKRRSSSLVTKSLFTSYKKSVSICGFEPHPLTPNSRDI